MVGRWVRGEDLVSDDLMAAPNMFRLREANIVLSRDGIHKKKSSVPEMNHLQWMKLEMIALEEWNEPPRTSGAPIARH